MGNSRILKFRAWDKKNEEWHDFDDGSLSIHADGTFELHENLVLMQYTGLKDKNGKQIYEGDIVEGKNNVRGTYVVEYLDEIAGFAGYNYVSTIEKVEKVKQYSAIFSERPLLSPDWEVEIIGNIYEYGHLLKD